MDYNALTGRLHPVNALCGKRLFLARCDLIVGDWRFVPFTVNEQELTSKRQDICVASENGLCVPRRSKSCMAQRKDGLVPGRFCPFDWPVW